jgi:lipoprotein-anchoring transpeptidase ErfK/SrfK
VNKNVIVGILALVVVSLLVWNVQSRGTKPGPVSSAVSKPAQQNAQRLYQQAVSAKRENDILTARKYYQEILLNHPEAENVATVQKELEDLSMKVLFSRTMVPDKTVFHEVAAGENLIKIARKYGTTVALIKRSNNLRDDKIHLGQKLRVWTGKFNILVDKSQNRLYLKDGNDLLKVYEVSTGVDNSSPVGTFTIKDKLENPVWFHKGVVVPPESPDNVLGTRWLGFDLAGYGIHGTVEPDKIGQQVTAGCVRMRNEEVEELYSIVPVGTQVTIVD